MKKQFAIIFIIASVFCLRVPAVAQSCVSSTCNAASPAQSDVLAALPASNNTNATVVVNIPSGTANWSTGFSYTIPAAVTNLTIQGDTTVNCTGTAGTSGYSCATTDNSVIQDVYQSNNALMNFTVGNSSTVLRITGLTWGGGSIGGSYAKYNGWVEIFGGSAQIRLDHNHMTDANYSPANQPVWFRSYGPITGVADHNKVDQTGTAYPFTFMVSPYNGQSGSDGDAQFATSTPWGTGTPFYIENNYVTGGVIDDCSASGSFVARYNSMINMTVATQTHATKTMAGSARGCRMYEAYHNYINNTNGTMDAALGSKQATSLIWGNTVTSGSYYNFWHSCTDRQCDTEHETATPIGWGFCGTSAIDPNTGSANGLGSPWDGNSSTGNGYPCLDGIGRGQTVQALNGRDFPSRLDSSTNAISWPHQYLEPVYMFMNTVPNGMNMFENSDLSSTNNRDIYYDCGTNNSTCAGGFNGTAGTGYGLLAARPSACSAGPGGTYGTSPTGSYGVAYFATDANGGNGELYVCTATNTWTGIYQPYTYPHPLVSGNSSTGTAAAPPAPTNLVSTAY